uniref:Uncharacterized protein n=1 Tax=Anas platyrhynchos TaxID=8839 RepID=A0A8B9SWK7_ANAPL
LYYKSSNTRAPKLNHLSFVEPILALCPLSGLGQLYTNISYQPNLHKANATQRKEAAALWRGFFPSSILKDSPCISEGVSHLISCKQSFDRATGGCRSPSEPAVSKRNSHQCWAVSEHHTQSSTVSCEPESYRQLSPQKTTTKN